MIGSADGCKAGWIVAVSAGWPCKKAPHLYLCRDFPGLLELTRSCEAVAIDIPIGLPQGSEKRVCDLVAKQKLGPVGRDRVFFTPPRKTLKAKTPEAFQDLHKQLTGVGAGYPVWGIVPKLREVDAAMRPKLQNRVYEYHPELAWLRLAGRVLESKSTRMGIEQRERILYRKVQNLKSIIEWRNRLGRAAKLDDVLDALVGLAVAEGIRKNCATNRRLPSEDDPPRDSRGLRMEIWY